MDDLRGKVYKEIVHPSVWVIIGSDLEYYTVQRAFNKIANFCVLSRYADGTETLNALRISQNIPALILLDFRCLGIKTEEFFEQFKSIGKSAAIPVIIWSQSATENDVTQFYKMGVSSFVRKRQMAIEQSADLESIIESWLKTTVIP